ncbi:hypothetical protein [Modestobacter sp. DSM 44400]|uniref:hypothetical protein n=1 Tax=Modestobacter sp. DSM 44400 TaxID=1550230 RepID=UPI000B860BD1|nr:hypothetical protein [Modestobacter sp. DSM 44400]
MTGTVPGTSLRAVFADRRGRLLLALLLAEFAAAVQGIAYITVLPLAARDLDGSRLYGATLAAGRRRLLAEHQPGRGRPAGHRRRVPAGYGGRRPHPAGRTAAPARLRTATAAAARRRPPASVEAPGSSGVAGVFTAVGGAP